MSDLFDWPEQQKQTRSTVYDVLKQKIDSELALVDNNAVAEYYNEETLYEIGEYEVVDHREFLIQHVAWYLLDAIRDSAGIEFRKYEIGEYDYVEVDDSYRIQLELWLCSSPLTKLPKWVKLWGFPIQGSERATLVIHDALVQKAKDILRIIIETSSAEFIMAMQGSDINPTLQQALAVKRKNK